MFLIFGVVGLKLKKLILITKTLFIWIDEGGGGHRFLKTVDSTTQGSHSGIYLYTKYLLDTKC